MNLLHSQQQPGFTVSEQRSARKGISGTACLVDQRHPLREQAEAFISQRFFDVHRALVSQFMPQMIAIVKDDDIRAVAGIRAADTQALFLEHYLDVPAERAIARVDPACSPVSRADIVEIGNLASIDRRASLELYPELTRYLVSARYEWAVFTGCSSLQRMFGKLGINTWHLGRALQSRLPHDQQTWGSYYEDNPSVVAGRVSLGNRVFNEATAVFSGRLVA